MQQILHVVSDFNVLLCFRFISETTIKYIGQFISTFSMTVICTSFFEIVLILFRNKAIKLKLSKCCVNDNG